MVRPGTFPFTFPNSSFLKIIGIVYSNKIEMVPETNLYTPDNYFTGQRALHLPFERCRPFISCRLRSLLGWTHRWDVQPSLRHFRRYHRLDRGHRGRVRPELVRADPGGRSLRKYIGVIWSHWYVAITCGLLRALTRKLP